MLLTIQNIHSNRLYHGGLLIGVTYGVSHSGQTQDSRS